MRQRFDAAMVAQRREGFALARGSGHQVCKNILDPDGSPVRAWGRRQVRRTRDLLCPGSPSRVGEALYSKIILE